MLHQVYGGADSLRREYDLLRWQVVFVEVLVQAAGLTEAVAQDCSSVKIVLRRQVCQVSGDANNAAVEGNSHTVVGGDSLY